MIDYNCKLCGESFHHLWELGSHLVDAHSREPGYGDKLPLWIMVYPQNGRWAKCCCGFRTDEGQLGSVDSLKSMLEDMARHTVDKNFDCLRKHVCSEALASL